MPSFAKKQRPMLRKIALSDVQAALKEIKLSGQQDNIRRFFKDAALSFSSLMMDVVPSSGFTRYGANWLKATAKYLDHLDVLSVVSKKEGYDRATALVLLRCHLLACLFRVDADVQSAASTADKIDETISDALGVKSISEIFI